MQNVNRVLMYKAGGIMPGRIAAWMVLNVLALCALSACAKPKYIIPGLTLPPSSTVVKFYDAPHKRINSRDVVVWFNCPSERDVVMRHVDKCMLQAGYRDVTADIIKLVKEREHDDSEGFDELNPVMAEPDNPDEVQRFEDIAKYYRLYRKQGSIYEVAFENNRGMDDSPTGKARSGERQLPEYKLADYHICIWTP